MNIIESEKKNFDELSNSSKNVIKIDNFLIYEKNDITNSNNTITNNDLTEKTPIVLTEIEKAKIIDVIKNVEANEISFKTPQKMCIMCNNNFDYNSLLKFKNLEEFLYFLKHCFATNYMDYLPEEFPAIIKNKETFFGYFKNYEKYYKSGYIFKSVKFICKSCFSDSLKQENGFHTIFNLLHISSNVLNSSVVKNNKKIKMNNIFSKRNDSKNKVNDYLKECSNNFSEIDESNFNIIVSREVLKNHPPKSDMEIMNTNNPNNNLI